MRKSAITILLCAFVLLAGCAGRDKAALVDWLQQLEREKTEITFWSQRDDFREQKLAAEETDAVLSALRSLTEEEITWNKHLAGTTPEYGLYLTVDGTDYHINQASAPKGQTEISYAGKQWWLESEELHNLMLSSLED